MRVIIVGASGMIGTAVEAEARAAGHQVIGTCATRPRPGLIHFDVGMHSLFDAVPDLGAEDSVLMLAAEADQAWVQAHPVQSHVVNFCGAVYCAQEALDSGAHFTFMSSEAVFGLLISDGFAEDAMPAPFGLYAEQKFKVEQRLAPDRTCIVRSGHVVGGAGHHRCAVSTTYRALLKPMAKMAFDNVFTVTAVEDVAAGLLRVAEARTCGTVHLVASPPVSRTQLADWIREDSRRGREMTYQQVPVSDLPMVKAPRAWLRSGRAAELGLAFSNPRSVVARKVQLLDAETF